LRKYSDPNVSVQHITFSGPVTPTPVKFFFLLMVKLHLIIQLSKLEWLAKKQVLSRFAVCNCQCDVRRQKNTTT